MSRQATSRLNSGCSASRVLCLALSLVSLFLLEPTVIWNAQAGVGHLNLTTSLPQQAQQSAGAPGTQVATMLELGKPIDRELAGGRSHSYQIMLSEGQYLNVVVEQRGIDVMVKLLGPENKQIVEIDSEVRIQGQEVVSQVAEVAGSYQLIVLAKQNAAPAGRYELRIVELRAAMEKDRVLQKARDFHIESLKLAGTGKYAEALSLVERALELQEKQLGAAHPDIALTLSTLANIHADRSDHTKAESLYQRALAIWEKVFGADHPFVAGALRNLAMLYRDKGDYAKAESLFQRALATWEKAVGPEHPDVAGALNSFARLYWDKEDFEKMGVLLQRALAIWEKTLGPEHPRVADSINNLALAYDSKGDYAKSEPLYQRALAIREKALGLEHPKTADSVCNLANLYYYKGEYVKAEPLYQRSLAIWEKAFGAEHPQVALALHNFANFYSARGDYAKAEPIYQRALAIREKVLGLEHPYVADSLNNLANLYQSKGDYNKAEPMLQRAIAIYEKTFGQEHSGVALYLDSLASLYYSKGEYVKAELLYQRAVAISEKVLGPEHPQVALSLNNLSNLYRIEGDYAKAEPLYQRALAIRERVLGMEHPYVAESLSDYARLYIAQGDLTKAVAFQSRAGAISERNIAINLATGSERQKLAYLATLSAQTDQTIYLCTHSASSDSMARSLAITTILQRKGRILDAMIDSLAAMRQRFNTQDQALLDQIKDANARLAQLVLSGPQRTTPAEHQKQIKDLEEQKEKLENEISRRSTEFRAQSQPVTLETVQIAIPANAVLVEFAAYRPFNPKAARESEAYGEPRYVAYVLRQQGEIQWKELGGAKAIDAAINALRQAMRDPKRQDVKELARVVDEKVMQPLRPLLRDTTHLLISPDGALNLIPFAALVDEQGRYLVERYSPNYLTSGRDLLRLQVVRESKSNPLVVADPAFGEPEVAQVTRTDVLRPKSSTHARTRQSVTTATDLSSVYFSSLGGAAEEAKAIKSLFPEATILTGEQATEASLKQAAAPQILHISTHGFFLEDQPMKIEGTRGDGGLRTISANVKIENPLLRSGLALAGANLRKESGDDGILTAMEAAGLNLWGTKLVVLSACDTGVGEVKNGEGVYGLRRALVLAGAETQVMSLWPVSDYVTRELITAYYAGLKQGMGRGEALRQVQLKMLRRVNRQHPFYWASFIQSGEWANLEGKR